MLMACLQCSLNVVRHQSRIHLLQFLIHLGTFHSTLVDTHCYCTHPKPSNSSIPAKLFRPRPLASFISTLPEGLISFVIVTDDAPQFVYNLSRSTLDTIASLIRDINKSLDASAIPARCTFLHSSPASHSAPLYLFTN